MLASPLLPMHIPDGFLSVTVAVVFWVIALVFLSVALRKTTQETTPQQMPLMGVLAAAIFAGQMLNFSVTGGTSGHLLGAALATILLGPWTAVVVMTAVVAVQALVFQDGGLLVLGANLFNMAIIGPFVSYFVFTSLQKLLGKHRLTLLVAGFGTAWCSIFVAALSCALQLVISQTSPLELALPAMAGIHALIGIGEGLITLGALSFIRSARPDLFQKNNTTTIKSVYLGGGIIALGLAICSPLASSFPDGLEWVAEKTGFLEKAQSSLYQIVPDYVLPGISDPNLATIGAGILGCCLVFAVMLMVGRLTKKETVTNQE